MTADATKDILILQNEPSVPRKKLISLVNSRLECRFVERDELVIVLLIFGISGGLENSSNVPHPVCCCHGSELAPNASAVNGTTTETCAQLTTSANHPASFNTTWQLTKWTFPQVRNTSVKKWRVGEGKGRRFFGFSIYYNLRNHYHHECFLYAFSWLFPPPIPVVQGAY